MEIQSLIEKNCDKMMDRFFGDRDQSLRAITKMNLMYDGSDEMREQIENTLTLIKRNNFLEEHYINQDFHLTYDRDGNLVLINDIKDNDEQMETEQEQKQNDNSNANQ